MKLGRHLFNILYALLIISSHMDDCALSQPIEPKSLFITLGPGWQLKPEDQGWQSACKNLGKSFLVGQGPWGLGLFSEIDCKSQPPSKQVWQLMVRRSSKMVHLVLQNSEKGRFVAITKFSSSPYDLALLSEKEFTDLLALALLDQLPFFARIDNAINTLPESEIKGKWPKGRFPLPPPPKELALYTADFDTKTGWINPEPIGRGILAAEKQESDASHTLKWRIAARRSFPTNSAVLAHNHSGIGFHSKVITPLIKKARIELVAKYEEDRVAKASIPAAEPPSPPTKVGTAQARYGIPVASKVPLTEGRFIAVSWESSLPSITGLWVAAEFWPALQSQELDFPVEVGGHYVTAGWKFGLQLQSFPIALDFSPVLGLWNFTVKTPFISRENEVALASFKINNMLTYGLRSGIEHGYAWYLIRGWAARDLVFRTAAADRNAHGSLTKFGLDLNLKWPRSWQPEGEYDLSVLLFYMREKIFVLHGKDFVTASPTLEDIEFTKKYAGVGLSITW